MPRVGLIPVYKDGNKYVMQLQVCVDNGKKAISLFGHEKADIDKVPDSMASGAAKDSAHLLLVNDSNDLNKDDGQEFKYKAAGGVTDYHYKMIMKVMEDNLVVYVLQDMNGNKILNNSNFQLMKERLPSNLIGNAERIIQVSVDDYLTEDLSAFPHLALEKLQSDDVFIDERVSFDAETNTLLKDVNFKNGLKKALNL